MLVLVVVLLGLDLVGVGHVEVPGVAPPASIPTQGAASTTSRGAVARVSRAKARVASKVTSKVTSSGGRVGASGRGGRALGSSSASSSASLTSLTSLASSTSSLGSTLVTSVTTSTSRGVGVSLCSNLVIEAVELLSQGAVHIEPPVAHEVLLVEQGAVGAEEAVLGEAAVAITATDVEGLALSLGVSVVSALSLAVTEEGGVRNLGEDGIIVSRDSGNVLLEVASTATSCSKIRGAAVIKASAASKSSR